MKVYCFKPNCMYSGGCFIVVANSPEEAFNVIDSSDSYFAECTDLKHCKEIDELVPVNADKPKLILDTMYVE